IVPPLAGDRVGADKDAAADNDAAAASGADDHAEDDRRAGGRAVGCLRQRETVRVVGKADRPLEQPRQILAERLADQPGRIRVLDEAARRRDRAGNADPDGPALAGVALNLAHETAD